MLFVSFRYQHVTVCVGGFFFTFHNLNNQVGLCIFINIQEFIYFLPLNIHLNFVDDYVSV